MRQSAILRVIYETLSAVLSGEGESTGLFTLCGDKAASEEVPGVSVRLEIGDICQTAPDKSGQRIIVEEMAYEAPAQLGVILSVGLICRTYPPLLECAGYIVRFFKDNHLFSLRGYGWHGNGGGDIFLEPVIREPAANNRGGERPSLSLHYRIEAGINSEKGESFRRVEKRKISLLEADTDRKKRLPAKAEAELKTQSVY
jgi:hypothetical protein